MPVSDATPRRTTGRRPVPAGWAEFGELLRHHRRRAGLTQSQLGARVGYHHSLISKWESGQRELAAPLVDRLDAALGAGGALRAAEGRLRAAEERQRAAEGQLRAAEGQLRAAEGQLRAGQDQLPSAHSADSAHSAPGPLPAPGVFGGAGLGGALLGGTLPGGPGSRGGSGSRGGGLPLPAGLADDWPSRLPVGGTPCPLHGPADCAVPEATALPPLVDTLLRAARLPPPPEDPDLLHALTALLNHCAKADSAPLPSAQLAAVEQLLRALAAWGASIGEAGRTPYAQLRLATHYAQTAGRLRLHRGQTGLAMLWFSHGLRWAEASGDAAAHAVLLTDVCTLSRLEGDPATSLAHAEALNALAGTRQLAGGGRHWRILLSHLYQARALAQLGAASGTAAQLALARRWFARLDADDLAEVPWLGGSQGELFVQSAFAGAHRDLAAAGGRGPAARQAVRAAEHALRLAPDRTQPVHLLLSLRLADSRACAGDAHGALATLTPVLGAAARSGRLLVTAELGGLHRRLASRWPHLPEVRELRDRLRAEEPPTAPVPG
ncbi:DNA-binding protein [Streptomyces albus]|uniref:DNA-binding protein n=1 Tax=Streptomyces albus (strain ATCC 21838 / DSM 41398 / FERM P-419 / JCM 4703 / NBRC 107858) TaxID=1081613 RepID=A0A0B5ENL0_STRA4|nr:DNA-binding protein [Streptomyces albus]AOU78550.1 DNA-binding protein [Streptomyces albus]AYN34294.1 XRE family transcriptional regulator [Streptomyces albus]